MTLIQFDLILVSDCIILVFYTLLTLYQFQMVVPCLDKIYMLEASKLFIADDMNGVKSTILEYYCV